MHVQTQWSTERLPIQWALPYYLCTYAWAKLMKCRDNLVYCMTNNSIRKRNRFLRDR